MPVRTPPALPPAPLDPAIAENTTILRHTFRVITPMHGGGVTSKECDKPHDLVTPIRAASIRGQLRFWWRACGRPEPLLDLAQLHREESRVWGSTTHPSPTTIHVCRQPRAPREVVVFTKDRGGRYGAPPEMRDIAYGAFPLKPGERSPNQPGTLHDFSADTFSLEIRLNSEHTADILTALQAWVLFGGLGGRTRRGFGAIEHTPAAGSPDETPFKVPAPQDLLDRLAGRHTLPDIPSLVGARLKLSRTSHDKPEAAWKNALGALQKLRQHPGLGRNPGSQQNRPGRSRWPEPDAIRSLLPLPRGGQYAHKVEHQIRKFPRAAFGLPIIFHFSTPGDPSVDTTLAPQHHERLASPLILRPLRQGSQYHAIALVLRGTALPGPLVLKPRNIPVQASLTAAEAAQIQPLNGHANALDAFLDHFERSAP